MLSRLHARPPPVGALRFNTKETQSRECPEAQLNLSRAAGGATCPQFHAVAHLINVFEDPAAFNRRCGKPRALLGPKVGEKPPGL